MRGNELLDTLENIDPALIERANRRPKRPWLRWTAAAACLALVIGLCTLFLPGKSPAIGPSPIPTVLDAPITPSKPNKNALPVKYVIYSSYSLGENDGFTNTDISTDNISFGSFSERDFSYATRKTISNEKAERQKIFKLDDVNIKADYFKSFSNSLADSADPSLQKFGRYDEYQSTEIGNRFNASFRQHDGELVFYSATDACDVDGSLTEQDAKALADPFFQEKYGEQFALEYPNCSIVVTDTVTEKIISVCYTKYICGYPTTDRVIITYNFEGVIKGINARTKGLFDSLEEDITAEKIANAEKTLVDTLPSTWSIGTKTLVRDADGGCYLRVTAIKTVEATDNSPARTYPMEFYINID